MDVHGGLAISVDVVLPTVRANVSTLRRVVEELPIPPAFTGLKFIIVVDGPQPEAVWESLRLLVAPNVVLLSTRPNHHGWPAGASAARNTGIDHSLADWVLFLDDDTMPEPDLLFEYWVAMERQLGPSAPHDGLPAFGFAGVTSFVEREDSLWAVVARCSGMVDAFTSAGRAACPPWSPTANLMLRRSAVGGGEGRAGGAPASCPTTTTSTTTSSSSSSSSAAAMAAVDVADEPSEREAEQVRLLPDSAADVRLPSVRHAAARAPWCYFDEQLPRNGGAEDVEICLRGAVHCDGAPSTVLPVEPARFADIFSSGSVDDRGGSSGSGGSGGSGGGSGGSGGGSGGSSGSSGRGGRGGSGCSGWLDWLAPGDPCMRPVARGVLIGVPGAVTYHRLWSPLGMLSRGLRWGYAGSQLARTYPELTRRRPMSTAEACVVAAPLAAALTAALTVALTLDDPHALDGAASGGGLAGCCLRPWRAALWAVALLLVDTSFGWAFALPSRLRYACHMPPHSRVTLDEPALFHACGPSRAARAAGLALLHAGPSFLLSLCFQLGELGGKLGRPWVGRRGGLRLLGCMWDFSFGSEPPPPPELMRKVAIEATRRAFLSAPLAATAVEWAASHPAPASAVLSAAKAAVRAVT